VENIDWGHLLFAFDGRINRAKFWLGLVSVWVALIIFGGIARATNSSFGWLLFAIVYVGVIWVGLAVSIKRWHDRDKSGWWVLIGLIPIIGALWALIETGFLEGTDGPNQYGPDPLAV
jgi:uncharacterized membrane protein YhaH (DUF805 family)